MALDRNEYEGLASVSKNPYIETHIVEKNSIRIVVLNKRVAVIQVNSLGNSAYCLFQYLAGADRNVAVLDIFAAIRRYWPNRPLNLQLDPAWALDSYYVGVVVQTTDNLDL